MKRRRNIRRALSIQLAICLISRISFHWSLSATMSLHEGRANVIIKLTTNNGIAEKSICAETGRVSPSSQISPCPVRGRFGTAFYIFRTRSRRL